MSIKFRLNLDEIFSQFNYTSYVYKSYKQKPALTDIALYQFIWSTRTDKYIYKKVRI